MGRFFALFISMDTRVRGYITMTDGAFNLFLMSLLELRYGLLYRERWSMKCPVMFLSSVSF